MTQSGPSSPTDPPSETTSQVLSRRERRKLELRARILETAAGLFGEQGFHETRVADICERADIAQKTFFNHFPSKSHLLREIAHSGIEDLLSQIEGTRKTSLATRDRVRLFFETVADHVSEAGPRNRELLTELVHVISGDAAERSDQARRLNGAFTAVVEDGVEQGDVTKLHDVQTLTEMIIGAYYVLIFNYANLDGFPIRERAAASARLLADALAPQPEE